MATVNGYTKAKVDALLAQGGGGGGGTAQVGRSYASPSTTRAQMQTIIDNLDSQGGGVVYLPAGVLNWTADPTPLVVRPAVHLEGVSGTGWNDGNINATADGTIIKVSPSVSAAVKHQHNSGARHLRWQTSTTWTGAKPTGTAVGVKVEGNGCDFHDVQANYFGGDGWVIDSEDTGAGNTGTLNVNNATLTKCSSSYNGGWGLTLRGSDSNAHEIFHMNAVANFGGQLRTDRASRNLIHGGHFDSAGKASICMEIDGIGNVLHYPYIEASGSPVGGDFVYLRGTGGVWTRVQYASGHLDPRTTPITLMSWRVEDYGGQHQNRQLYSYRGRRSPDGTWQRHVIEDVGVPDGVSMYRMQMSTGPDAATPIWDVDSYVTRSRWHTPLVPGSHGMGLGMERHLAWGQVVLAKRDASGALLNPSQGVTLQWRGGRLQYTEDGQSWADV